MDPKIKKLMPQVALKLRQVREKLNFTPKEMAARLGVSSGAYYKNETAETFPGFQSLYRLSSEYDISMDWFLFGKGPEHFRHKEKVEELEQQLAQAREELAAARHQARQAEAGGAAAIPVKDGETLIPVNPEVKELLEHMEAIPLLYHETLARFQEFKIGRKDLVAEAVSSAGVTPGSQA